MNKLQNKITKLYDSVWRNKSTYVKLHTISLVFHTILSFVASGVSFNCLMFGMYGDGAIMMLCSILALTNSFHSFVRLSR
jgi:hypothetical protein